MSSKLAALLIAVAPLVAESGLLPPRIGYVRDANGSVRALVGVRGNFLLAEPIVEQVRAAAFSARAGVVKTESEILLLDGQEQVLSRAGAPGGAALFGFDPQGSPAAAYFPETGELYRFKGTDLVKVTCGQVRADEPVRALSGASPNVLTLAVERGGGIWLVSLDTEKCETLSEASLPGVSASLVLLPNGSLVYVDGSEAVVRHTDMSESRVPLAAASARLELLAPNWVHVGGDDGRSWALHVKPDEPELYRLPGGAR